MTRAIGGAMLGGHASADLRTSLVPAFVEGAAISVRRAFEIEDLGEEEGQSRQPEHMSLVTSAVLQSAAAIEAEASEVAMHGPGCRVGKVNQEQLQRLRGLSDLLLPLPTLRRYQKILELLGRDLFVPGREPWQSAALLVKLRNELVHFKSVFERDLGVDDMTKGLERVINGLESHRFSPAPFHDFAGTVFFPHKCLSASLASWAVTSTVKFLDEFSERLDVPPWTRRYGRRFVVPEPRKAG